MHQAEFPPDDDATLWPYLIVHLSCPRAGLFWEFPPDQSGIRRSGDHRGGENIIFTAQYSGLCSHYECVLPPSLSVPSTSARLSSRAAPISRKDNAKRLFEGE